MRKLSLAPQLWGELTLDLSSGRFTELCSMGLRRTLHSLRMWVMQRPQALHTLRVTFPGYPHGTPAAWGCRRGC